MNDKFDELAKGMARSVTRRAALKKFGVGLAGVVLATLGLSNKAEADPNPSRRPGGCRSDKDCPAGCRCLPTGEGKYKVCFC